MTGAAAHTLEFVDNRKPLRAHVDGVELTGLDAIPHAHATDGADPFAAVEGGHGRAGHGAVVDELVVGAVTAAAGVEGLQGLGGSRIHAHDSGDIDGRFRVGDHTDAGAGLAFNDAHGCRTASGKAAAAAVGAGEKVLYFADARIFIDVKDFGGDTEDDAAGCANAQHDEDSDGHENLLDSIYTMPRKA